MGRVVFPSGDARRRLATAGPRGCRQTARLVVRSWQPGDAMTCPDALTPRKVKHFLSDAGVTGHERTAWPVVLAGDQVVWIPGVRRSDAATVRSGRPGLPFVCEYYNR